MARIAANSEIAVQQRLAQSATAQQPLLPGSFVLLKAAFLEGEVARGQAAAITGD